MKERMRRLNGWQRIGIVASVLWFLVGGYWASYVEPTAHGLVALGAKLCVEVPNANFAACDQEFARDWPHAMHEDLLFGAFAGLVPIPLAWLSVYGLIGIVRWVRRGFQPHTQTDFQEKATHGS